ncbi:hypothetical protein OF83DRAFT_1176462 [Amylostereum chailletii]|nr:hypothetical protein OF83DRAFT_1176462 [Amylostereum chailletii]
MASPSSSHLPGERPSKRSRTEDNNVVPVIVKSADLWFSDGNIVLRTVFTPPESPIPHHTMYNVHKGVLALNSSVFHDLFEGSQAAFNIGSEMYEGIPVMDMPDSPEDVAHFLKALYFPKYTQRHYAAAPLKALPDGYAGILRLSTKYDVPSLRETAISAFKLVWPSTLPDWHNLQMTIAKDGPFPELSANSKGDISELHEDPAKAIRLAYDCRVPEVLPVAYYDLVRVYARNGRCSSRHYRTSDISILTTDELKRFLSGMGELQHTMVTKLMSLPGKLHNPGIRGCVGCIHPPERIPTCGDNLRMWWLEQTSAMEESSGDILTWLCTLAGALEGNTVCTSCADKWKRHQLRGGLVGDDWGKT